MEKGKYCPICKEVYFNAPALSRVDNKTLICPSCGNIQAIDVFKKALEQKKKDL